MSKAYTQHVLKIAVAQICQTIGWHSAHTSTMDLLIDVTQHFLREISRIMHRYCELYNRTEANLNDLALAYKEIGINLDELMEYVQYVEPIPLPLEVPRFPIPKESCLNFLKPGSREVLTRPVHIPEYMPPLIFEDNENGFASCVAALMRVSEEDRIAVENFKDTKVIQNNTSLAIAVTAPTTLSLGEQCGLLNRKVCENSDICNSRGVDDGSISPHVVINEEVEIPMQTIEVQQQATVTTAREKMDDIPYDVDRKRSERVLIMKDSTHAAEISFTLDSKTSIIVEEGRPTRQISSVIMTTSGFISPAREGKLPESRIPIILEERLIPESLATVGSTPHFSLESKSPVDISGTTGSLTISTSATVPSMALMALPVGTNYYSNQIDDLATGGTSGGGVSRGLHHQPALPQLTSPLPLPSQLNTVSGKPAKKAKKKPDREKKKTEKNLADFPSKLDDDGVASIDSLKLPPSSLELNVREGISFENMEKEKHNFSSMVLGKVAPLPPQSGEGERLAPCVKSQINDMFDGVLSLTGPTKTLLSKPTKYAEVKIGKQKPTKKRKSASPKLLLAKLEIEQEPKIQNAEEIHLPRASTVPPMFPSPFTSPKPKKVSKKKVSKQHQGQRVSDELPPPLIGPLGINNPPIAATDANITDGMLNMLPNAPNNTAFSLSLKKHPNKGTITHDDHLEKHSLSSHKHQVVDKLSQLNLLQMMHPSLEITASPPIIPQDMLPNLLKPSFVCKDMKSDTLNDRGVIVIDDDKTLPHVSSMISSVDALASTRTTTTTSNKKNHKQAAQFSGDFHLVDAKTIEYAESAKILTQKLLLSNGSDKRDESGDLQYMDEPQGQQLSPAGIPNTPDIKHQHSSSSSSSSWKSESPSLPTPNFTTPRNMFSELPSKTFKDLMPLETHKKQKRPKQKSRMQEAKRSKLTADGAKKTNQFSPTNQPDLTGNPNPFGIYPCEINTFGSDVASAYSKIINQVAGLPRIPFGLLPLSSGPGLIPDNPLFPRLPRHGFTLTPNTFGIPHGVNAMNLLRIPGFANRLPGMVNPTGGNQRDLLDEPLDPETKLAQTPLDLQKSTCNVAPLVPPSLFQSASESITLSDGNLSTNQMRNLSVKSTNSSGGDKETIVLAQSNILVNTDKAFTNSNATTYGGSDDGVHHPSIASQTLFSNSISTCMRDQVVILPAASVLPGACTPQRSNMLVIDVDDSDGSQSTATTGGKSKDDRRKQKEHKKDRRKKDGKIKKKKGKKDKSKGKDRNRQHVTELTAGNATSPGMMTMGMIGAEEALMEQLRKERKEKKEKRKEKLKREKRKEKEAHAEGGLLQATTSSGAEPASEVGLKLMLKIAGSNATQSPRSETPEQLGMTSSNELRRDGSPELAKISALVTRPPKLKGSMTPGSKSKKDDVGGKSEFSSPVGSNSEHFKLQCSTKADHACFALKQSAKVNMAGSLVEGNISPMLTSNITTDEGGSNSTGRNFKTVRVIDGLTEAPVKPFGGMEGESSKKASSKESKSIKSVQSQVASDTFNSTPVNMTDVDGNTVWICPACGRVDDGTPMIGCDGCDAWYHWVCVGIQVPPDDNEDWYCRVCIAKKQFLLLDEKQRKRKKKDKKSSKD